MIAHHKKANHKRNKQIIVCIYRVLYMFVYTNKQMIAHHKKAHHQRNNCAPHQKKNTVINPNNKRIAHHINAHGPKVIFLLQKKHCNTTTKKQM